jgi:uncharacterized protein YegP (UPF0339 family)
MKSLFGLFQALVVGALVVGGACTADELGAGSENAVESASDPIMQAKPEAPGEFAVLRAADGKWHFHAVGAQGAVLLLSQPYVERSSALNGILSVKDNGVLEERYEVSTLADGQFAVVLKAANGQVIAESNPYATAEEADAAIPAARDLVAGILRYEAAMTQGARFTLWKEASDNEWHFKLLAADGEALLNSEGYTGRTGAVNGIESVRANGTDAANYQVVEAGGEAYLSLTATNGQEIAQSGRYESVDAANAGLEEIVALLQSERVGDPW